MRENKRLK